MPKSPKKDKNKQAAPAIQAQKKQSLQPKGMWKDNPQGTK